MKCGAFILAVLAFTAHGAETNPIAKVLDMISDLQTKVIGEGHEAQKIYTEFAEMCEDTSQGLHNEIKVGKGQIAELEGTIEKAAADITVFEETISDLAGKIASDEADLKKATEIREKEHADFSVEQKELLGTISTIERAVGIVEKEMGGGASFAQASNAQTAVTQALTAMVDAQAISAGDSSRLMSLVQSSTDDSEEDESLGAPDPAAYKSQSGGIVETLDGLLEKAEKSLEDVRKQETASLQSYEMQKQSLTDKIKFAKKELAEAKKSLASTSEAKAGAEGDLTNTKKDLAEDIKELEQLHHECLTKATSFEEETKSRGEELKALAQAKKIIQESTGGAAGQSYDLNQESVSFVQVKAHTKEASSSAQALNMVRHLAMEQRSQALVQLVSKIESVMNAGVRDPFAKVKDLIKGMIEKLLDEAEADATKKAYCDKEMSETETNKEDKEADIEKLTTQIDVMSAESKKLKGEVATLQKELAALSRMQAEMDKIRMEEKTIYDKNKPEMEKGLEGIKLALKVLREYYAKDDKDHSSGDGAASGIIGLLEVTESDFSKGLAELVAEEEAAVSEYETTSKENELAKAAKEQDVKYKTKSYVGLDKSIAELKADLSGVKEELAAVMEYFATIKKECIAKPESYESRVKRREQEIAGLKEALSTLEGGAAVLLQSGATHRRTLRGAVA